MYKRDATLQFIYLFALDLIKSSIKILFYNY